MGFRHTVRGIRPGSVGALELADGAVTYPKLGENAVRTAESGRRVEMNSGDLNALALFSGSAAEKLPGMLSADVAGAFARAILQAPDPRTDAPTSYRNEVLMYEDVTDQTSRRETRTQTVRTAHVFLDLPGGGLVHIDGRSTKPDIDLAHATLRNVDALPGWSPASHDHAGVYAAAAHTHPYAAAAHTHPYAAAAHTHPLGDLGAVGVSVINTAADGSVSIPHGLGVAPRVVIPVAASHFGQPWWPMWQNSSGGTDATGFLLYLRDYSGAAVANVTRTVGWLALR